MKKLKNKYSITKSLIKLSFSRRNQINIDIVLNKKYTLNLKNILQLFILFYLNETHFIISINLIFKINIDFLIY